MQERTCIRCDKPLIKKPGPGRWPTICASCKTPREARPSRYKRRAPVVSERECEVCGTSFATTHARMCSQRCRSQASYLRKKATPEAWEQYLADCRKRYVPKGRPPGPAPKQATCGVDGCESKHLAKGFCSSHYRKWRRAEGLEGNDRCPVTVVGSMASLFGAYFPKPKPIKVRVTVGLMAYCPWCSDFMDAASPIHRACRSCGTTATLNEEEVSWVTSEMLSTAA